MMQLQTYQEKEYDCLTLEGELSSVKLWIAPGVYPVVIMPEALAKELEPAYFNRLLTQVVSDYQLDCSRLSWIGAVQLPPPLPAAQLVLPETDDQPDSAPPSTEPGEAETSPEPQYAYVLFSLHWSLEKSVEKLEETSLPDVSWEGSYQALDRLVLSALVERLGLSLD